MDIRLSIWQDIFLYMVERAHFVFSCRIFYLFSAFRGNQNPSHKISQEYQNILAKVFFYALRGILNIFSYTNYIELFEIQLHLNMYAIIKYYNFYMETGRSFKIRKASTKVKTAQEIFDQELVTNLEDLRLAENNDQEKVNVQNEQAKVLHPAVYQGDEENINCYRFPHSSFCGCQPNCLLESFEPIEVMNGLYFGNFVTGLKAKHLLDLEVTHILNVTCKQYTKREQYFRYCNIDLRNTTEEDAKKFFRLSNRFIKDALDIGGKVLVHCSVLEIGAVMVCAYMIGILKISLKQSLTKLSGANVEISPHFLKQLQAYDLEKMAFVSIQRE